MAASSQASRGLGALIKRGWNEIPEIMGSSCIALIGLAIGGYTIYKYQGWDGQYRQYRMSYTVYRPDDPRVAKIRKD
ncbi:hypothetical protein R5R35_010305 [Gryllus longicercus]|uniref:Uncharacterized protein n=1 Tax=Gryllus longicercus TaxID=2509291 RepID=A0AAN9V898_9ORTH